MSHAYSGDTSPPPQTDDEEMRARAAAAATERAPRRTAKRDANAMTISAFNADGSPAGTFDARELPSPVFSAMALEGAWAFMRAAENPEIGWQNLKVGKLPKQRNGEKAPKKVSLWRQAVAHALVEKTRKTDSPYTLETALDRTRMMTREDLIPNKSHPLVVKHFHRLSGTSTPDTLEALI